MQSIQTALTMLILQNGQAQLLNGFKMLEGVQELSQRLESLMHLQLVLLLTLQIVIGKQMLMCHRVDVMTISSMTFQNS